VLEQVWHHHCTGSEASVSPARSPELIDWSHGQSTFVEHDRGARSTSWNWELAVAQRMRSVEDLVSGPLGGHDKQLAACRTSR